MLELLYPQDFERYIETLLKKPIQFNHWIGFLFYIYVTVCALS